MSGERRAARFDSSGGHDADTILWTPSRLKAVLDETPAKAPRTVVLDVRLGEAYARGHVPGAIHFSIYGLNTYDTDPAPLRSFAHMWAFLLSQRGLSPDDRVVVCGEKSGMTAARAFWFLEYLGYAQVGVLDGGFRGWEAAGLPSTQDAELPNPVACRYTLDETLSLIHI